MTVTSVPHLYATAHLTACEGPRRCFYCGAPCGEKHPASVFVKDSFTGRNGVVAPGSPWVCEGCVLCLRESATIHLVGGEIRDGQKVRGYSWIVTRGSAQAATKAHLDTFRAICLEPPEPPFALILSDSGQTHQLYRGVVNHARDPITVTLEAEPVTFHRDQLAAALEVGGKIAAATGKPALSEPIRVNSAARIMGRYRDGETLIRQWSAIQESGLGRLAAWLTPRKELCESVYRSDIPPDHAPRHGGVPPQARRPERPAEPGDGARRKGQRQGLGDQVLLNFG